MTSSKANDSSFASIEGLTFRGVSIHNDVYPTIDPKPSFDNKSFKGKTVVITGASRGLGEEYALYFARAGASVSLVARDEAKLKDVKAKIESENPYAKVLTFSLDARDVDKVDEAIKATVKSLGRLDVLVANAGKMQRVAPGFASQNPREWWNVMDVNIHGVYNFVHFSLPHLQQSKGTIVAVSSLAAQIRYPGMSDYALSKFAINRLVEYITLEYPEVKAFSIHPGSVITDMYYESGVDIPMNETRALSAAAILYLASGKANYLSGRYVSAMWDLGELEKFKDEIIERNALVAKLDVLL